jgi:hypothetical protein
MHDGLRQRYYLPPGARWKLVFSVRDSFYPAHSREGKRIEASHILAQAEAALWLLCHFGGIGSRSRKGFGSLVALELTMELAKCIATAAPLPQALRCPRHRTLGFPGPRGSSAYAERRTGNAAVNVQLLGGA